MQIPSRSIGFLLFLFSWLCTTQAAAPNTPISIIQDVIINGTLTAGIPAQFSADPLLERGGDFDPFACFELAVRSVAALVAHDPTDQIRPAEWNIDGLTIEVSLSGVQQRRVRGIQVRYVIWGIYEAVKGMIVYHAFRATTYQLKWQGTIVGTLGFRSTQVLLLPNTDDANGNITQNVAYVPLSNSTDPALLVMQSLNTSASTASNTELEVQILGLEGGRSLNPYAIFINILGLLVDAAEYSGNLAIRSSFTTTVGGSGVQATVSGPETSKPMSRRPWLTYHWLCRGLGTGSEILVSSRYFKEFKIKLLLQGVELGNVDFRPSSEAMMLRKS
ncbi:hypothetical protein MMC28_009006 [Mycoblastus sanguinarius]|nr:hypothetical protein [Mycoblastus sanguinarius]